MANAVLVIDMLRGFLEEGNPLYCGIRARHIISNIQQLIDSEIAKGATLFFVCDHHASNDPEFSIFPPHCIAGTTEAEIIPELADYRGEVILKQGFNAFYNTGLKEKLCRLKPQKIVIAGVCTDICICHSVSDARSHGYEVEVPVDCVASFDEKAHSFALGHMEKVLGVKLTKASCREIELPRFEPDNAILSGETADIYFLRTLDVLRGEKLNPEGTMEIFSSRDGILCGVEEAKALLERVLPENHREVWALVEGDTIEKKEVVLRIIAPYQSYALYETAICGILAQCSGWATAARECVQAAHGIPVISFGARHVHPSVVGVMDYSAIIGGCAGCSSVVGSRLAGIQASGTMPHSLVIMIGDTVEASAIFDKYMPRNVPRIALVDTFKDEVEESLLVARALGDKLNSVRLDTPSERGGVTTDLVREVRAALDRASFEHVKIFVSGGITLERIHQFVDEGVPVDGFGVGGYITSAQPINFTADLHAIAGKPIAKRGRIPGITANPRLKRVL